MALGKLRRAIGVFSSARNTEVAIDELKTSGFPMHNISIIARDDNGHHQIGGVDVDERSHSGVGQSAVTGALTGGAVGGFVGLIGALSSLVVPGIGPVVAGGAVASVIGDALLGGAIGAATGGVVGALVGLGVPEDSARNYNDRIVQGHYLIILEGTEDEIHPAEAILHRRGIEDFAIYDIADGDSDRVGYVEDKADDAPVVDTHPTSYATERLSEHPDVIVIDRREKTP
ncbi:MAG TPA: hypothetical protein DDZ80_26470 [Cyanobacteria bacterium UBA8803]|nr:hypothetical protein [Cyanobacteria bacterium UBA9273]HBL61828.1 hypothetical protein [Cyanobacteria bacterium UBA8803]